MRQSKPAVVKVAYGAWAGIPSGADGPLRVETGHLAFASRTRAPRASIGQTFDH